MGCDQLWLIRVVLSKRQAGQLNVSSAHPVKAVLTGILLATIF